MKMKIKQFKNKKIIIIALSIFIGLGIYYASDIYSLWPNIKPFEINRDASSVTDIIQRDVYWFFNIPPKGPFTEKYLAHYLSTDFSFYVLRKYHKTIGFIIYKKLDPETGNINLIGVDRSFRKLGYAEKLLKFACTNLFKEGCNKIKLYTRLSNTNAVKLYIRSGFEVTKKDDEYIYFEKIKN